jgi:hypothetical protein
MSSTNRRSFLARGAALAAVPTVAALAGGALNSLARSSSVCGVGTGLGPPVMSR